MHTFTAKHVLYSSAADQKPLGVQVYFTPDQWRGYEASPDHTAQVIYTLLDGTSHQHTFMEVGQVDLVQEEGFEPYFKVNFWFDVP